MRNWYPLWQGWAAWSVLTKWWRRLHWWQSGWEGPPGFLILLHPLSCLLVDRVCLYRQHWLLYALHLPGSTTRNLRQHRSSTTGGHAHQAIPIKGCWRLGNSVRCRGGGAISCQSLTLLEDLFTIFAQGLGEWVLITKRLFLQPGIPADTRLLLGPIDASDLFPRQHYDER